MYILTPPLTAERPIAFTLQDPRVLNVSLYDLSGSKLSALASNVRRNAGTGQIAFTLENVQAGMSLVILTTDKDEKVVHRFIIP